MLIVESPIDAYSLLNIIGANCGLIGQKAPYSLENCTEQEKEGIEKYRKMAVEQLQNFRGREDVGIWGPACVQHGFTDSPSFADPDFKVAGMMAYEAIEEFLRDPTHAKWNLDEQAWPSNQGCSGIPHNYDIKQDRGNWDI